MSTKDESLEFVGRYIGAEEVVSIKPTGDKTPLDSMIYEFIFKGGKTMRFPAKVIPYVLSEKKTDATKVQEARMEPIVREMLQTVMEYDLDYGDVEALLKSLHLNIMSQYDRASNTLWGGDDEDFVPGMDPMYGRTLLDAYKVLETIPQKDGGEGENTTGGDTTA